MTARVLVVSPHPDDETLGCGGTLAKLARAGAHTKVVFLTSGEAGGHGTAPSDAGHQREKEAEAAADILGIGCVEFWRERDGQLEAAGSVVQRLRTELDTWSPDVVYAPHEGEMHSDHAAAARIASLATAGSDIDVQFFEVWTPLSRMDEIVDITDTVEVKVAAIRAYASQCRVMRFDDAFLGLARYRGEMFSWPDGDYAEVFVRAAQ